MSKVRWGILSTSNFAQSKVIPALLKCERVEVAAIASRDLARAREAARRFGVPKAYGSYEQLLADPEIEVIYNPAPNHLHVSWSIKALEAGKHTLCEKPIGLNAADALQLLEASKKYPKLKVMEAFMYRHHPQWRRAKRLVEEGGVGAVRTINSFFSYFNDDPDNIRNKPEIGGGGLMDIGCYNISLSRFIFGEEPNRVLGVLDYDPKFKTDRIASGILNFGDGDFGRRTATFTCSTQLAPYQRASIFGDAGHIEIEIPFNAPPDRACRIWHATSAGVEEITFDICDQYTIQGEEFSLAVINDTPVPTPLEDAVANMKVIEAVVESGRSGQWIEMGSEQ